ncbi:hypothetical protein BVY01_00495, partial [bacterium I07]
MTCDSKHINRRSFLLAAAAGMGTAAVSGNAVPFVKTRSKTKNSKKLFATTDFADNIIVNSQFMNKAQLNELNKHLASLGVTRHQWTFDTIWTLYDDYPHGFDLLAEATSSAHRHGLEFYALIKPFEAGAFRRNLLPHTFPFPENACAFKDMRGIYPVARPFAAANSHMNLKRKPGSYEYEGPVKGIRLVKENDKPTRIKYEHLSLWTSSLNNNFIPYTGRVVFRETLEWRFVFPKWQPCRILHLEELEIPKDHAYIIIKCQLADGRGDFSNESGRIIELTGPEGQDIPYYPGSGPVSPDSFKRLFTSPLMTKLIRYLQLPEVQKQINDPVNLQKHFSEFYQFEKMRPTDSITLDRNGYLALVCGKPEYVMGSMHPIYPEVREHWLELVRFCLDRGVDGINLRAANHTRPREHQYYGFNEPVLEASGGRTDFPTIARINGNAYTEFLREARDLIKSKGKSITIHLHATMLSPDDRRWRSSHQLPGNFEWQWRTWVREIADDLEFRGGNMLRQWNLEQ